MGSASLSRIVRRNMLRSLAKPTCAIVSDAALLLFLWSLGGFVLSDGWLRIDSSAYRDLLYVLMLKVIPVAVIASVIHIAVTIARVRVWVPSVLAAVLLGATGPLLLHFSIVASDDPVAGMNYLFLVPSYSLFFVIAFLASLAVVSRIRRNSGERDVEPSAGGNAE